MELIRPSFKIIAATISPLELVEVAGRACYQSHDKTGPDSADKFTRMLIKKGHHAMLEFGVLVVRFIVDRGVTHELVRHRLASFAQESTRYCNYGHGIRFVIPPWVEGIEPGPYGDARVIEIPKGPDRKWASAMINAEYFYTALMAEGWQPQQARAVLPNSLAAEIVIQANMREWRHIFTLRAAKPAHPQMKEVMRPLLAECINRWPALFDDIPEKIGWELEGGQR